MNRYKSAFSRLDKGIAPLQEYYGKTRLFFLCDALWSFLKYGVTPNEYLGFQFYRFSSLERARFYTARKSYKYEKIFNDKNFYNTFWQKEKTNKAFAKYVKRDWLFVPDESEDAVADFINRHDKIIVKPSALSSGRGIHIYDDESIRQLREQKALLEAFVVQHHELNKLNSSSVNTIRVYTVKSKNSKLPPHILSMTIRVGGKGSCVDNYHAGGVGYPIDVETGIIMAPGTDISGKEYLFHPSTGVKMVGFQLPNYSLMKKYIMDLCNEIPSARLIAWDIAILENGFDLIEANYDGDPGLMQSPAKRGLWPIIKQYL